MRRRFAAMSRAPLDRVQRTVELVAARAERDGGEGHRALGHVQAPALRADRVVVPRGAAGPKVCGARAAVEPGEGAPAAGVERVEQRVRAPLGVRRPRRVVRRELRRRDVGRDAIEPQPRLRRDGVDERAIRLAPDRREAGRGGRGSGRSASRPGRQGHARERRHARDHRERAAAREKLPPTGLQAAPWMRMDVRVLDVCRPAARRAEGAVRRRTSDGRPLAAPVSPVPREEFDGRRGQSPGEGGAPGGGESHRAWAEPRAQRTLVKSPPELWAEVSDPGALAGHLGAFGEIRITRLDPESTVAWEGDRARGTVELEASGWGTKVTLVARLDDAPAPSEPVPAPRVPEAAMAAGDDGPPA